MKRISLLIKTYLATNLYLSRFVIESLPHFLPSLSTIKSKQSNVYLTNRIKLCRAEIVRAFISNAVIKKETIFLCPPTGITGAPDKVPDRLETCCPGPSSLQSNIGPSSPPLFPGPLNIFVITFDLLGFETIKKHIYSQLEDFQLCLFVRSPHTYLVLQEVQNHLDEIHLLSKIFSKRLTLTMI